VARFTRALWRLEEHAPPLQPLGQGRGLGARLSTFWPPRRHQISLARRRGWCVRTDPCFAQKAPDVIGLYLQPPDNAVVMAVDEKPHIQALGSARGWLKLPNNKALNRFSHDYKRHGTTTLYLLVGQRKPLAIAR
jgi:hypothetical protein